MGVASAASYALAGHAVTLVELDPRRRGQLAAGTLPFHEDGLARAWRGLRAAIRLAPTLAGGGPALDAVVCCVGTPSGADGAADLSQVTGLVERLRALPPTVFVVRSTVPPGTGVRLAERLGRWGHAYAAQPEFLQEGSAFEDSLRPTRVVIGAADPAVHDRVAALAPARCPVLRVDIPTAEFIKIAANAHLAMRVSFMNEMAGLCARVGADITQVAVGIGLDPRIGPHFLRAGLGYGGSCFPKDTRALSALGRSLDTDLPMLAAVIAINARQPARCAAELASRLGGLRHRRIGVWGLAFKPGTDDVRESPALRLLEELATAGARLAAHDPVVAPDLALPLGCLRVATPLEAAAGAAALVLATEWPEYLDQDPAAVAAVMEPPALLLDGRNALAPADWEAAGLWYLGVGRPARVDGGLGAIANA